MERNEPMTDELAELRELIPHVWADFAQMKNYYDDPFILDSGDGIYVTDVDGNRYIDTLAGTASVSVGHCNPVIVEAMVRQIGKMTFASPNSSVNTASLRLLKLLLTVVPPGFTTIKFFSGGSEANEGMMKAARQFFWQTGRPNKYKIIGRFGESVGGTIACKAAGGVPAKFGPALPGFAHVHPGNIAGGCAYCRHRGATCDLSCAQAVEDTIRAEDPNSVAAVIGAPVGQTIWPHPEYWPAVRAICDRYDVLLLYDEIVTGFGRLGTMWGADFVNAYPDLMGVGKGMSGGYAPLSALLIHERVAEAFWGDENRKFDEGHTFNANPLSAAVGHAVLSYILEHDLVNHARRVGAHLLERVRTIAERYDAVTEVVGAGLWVAAVLARDPRTGLPAPDGTAFGRALHQAGRRHGLLIRPYGSHVLLAPPLTITMTEIDDMVERLDRAMAETFASTPLQVPDGHVKTRYPVPARA